MNITAWNNWIDGSLAPFLTVLGWWSLRWAVLILIVMVCIVLRIFRTTALRSAGARCVLLAGLLLPLVPQFWGPTLGQAVPARSSVLDASPAPVPVPEPSSQPTFEDLDDPILRLEPGVAARPVPRVKSVPVGSSIADASGRPATVGPARWTLLAVAVCWIGGVLLQLIRLAIGWWWLTRMCRNAAAVCANGEAELMLCRQHMAVRRTVQLKVSQKVETPILVGGLHPCILIPGDWEVLSIESRRAILLHELAHVKRYDDFSKLFEEVVRAVFFFHPLVHWLLSRIGIEREELCDGLVMQQGIAPCDLAAVLLEACRVFNHARQGVPRGLVLPFFRRRSVKDRIQSLMEESTMSQGRMPLKRRAYAALGLVLTANAVLVAGFGLHAEEPQPTAIPNTKVSGPPTAVSKTAPTPALSLDLSQLITTEAQVKDLQNDLPIEIKGFGKLSLETLATLMYCEKAEAARGRLVDIQGKPLSPTGTVPVSAVVTTLPHDPNCVHWAGESVIADAQGRFAIIGATRAILPPNQKDIPPEFSHDSIPLMIRLAGGQTFETLTNQIMGKMLDVHVPTHLNPKVPAPQNVKADEIAGVVVDEHGQALEGVEVDIYDSMDVGTAKIRTSTDQQGQFRLRGLEEYIAGDGTTVIRFRKPGYSPERFMHQPLGVKGWVVALAGRTYLEGIVKGPDGKPVAGALVRGHQGPKEVDGGIIPDLWTDAVSDASGKYRLYLQPDEYELHVKGPGVGVARIPKQTVFYRDQRTVDIDLQTGVKFQAIVLDSLTQEPVPNVRLWHWQYPGVEGRSDAAGTLTIADMSPGEFSFMVEAKGYARWWSNDCNNEWSRLNLDTQSRGIQRNFDDLDFDLKTGMPTVRIFVEKAVRITGRVVDPDGQPVAGATVDGAKTGDGNSLSGDTRFSVETQKDGTYTLLLPASHGATYNLLAHDGKYGEWRRWANGVLPPIKTRPGEEIKATDLQLTRPAVVRGKVVDDAGQPLADYEVEATPTAKVENRYYLPKTTTKADGTFELGFVRPGQHVLTATCKLEERVEDGIPVTMSRRTAPSKPLTLKSGETVSDIILTTHTESPNVPQ